MRKLFLRWPPSLVTTGLRRSCFRAGGWRLQATGAFKSLHRPLRVGNESSLVSEADVRVLQPLKGSLPTDCRPTLNDWPVAGLADESELIFRLVPKNTGRSDGGYVDRPKVGSWPVADRHHPTPSGRFPHSSGRAVERIRTPAQWRLLAGRSRPTLAHREQAPEPNSGILYGIRPAAPTAYIASPLVRGCRAMGSRQGDDEDCRSLEASHEQHGTNRPDSRRPPLSHPRGVAGTPRRLLGHAQARLGLHA